MPVWPVVDRIDQCARVSKGEIRGFSAIGSLKTIWSELGSVSSLTEYRSEKFMVNQVINALEKPPNNENIMSKKGLSQIRKFTEQLESDKLRLTVKLQKTYNDLMTIDGNKSSVAYFEHCKLRKRITHLLVFVISLCS